MKLCIFSDAHGGVANMIDAAERERPDMCFFLGDGERDLTAFRRHFPDMTVMSVRGNCDLRSQDPLYLNCVIEGVNIFAAHGHRYHVKADPYLDDIRDAAAGYGARVILFGHTHEAYLSEEKDMLIMNPGAIGRHRYGILELSGGSVRAQLKIQ